MVLDAHICSCIAGDLPVYHLKLATNLFCNSTFQQQEQFKHVFGSNKVKGINKMK